MCPHREGRWQDTVRHRRARSRRPKGRLARIGRAPVRFCSIALAFDIAWRRIRRHIFAAKPVRAVGRSGEFYGPLTMFDGQERVTPSMPMVIVTTARPSSQARMCPATLPQIAGRQGGRAQPSPSGPRAGRVEWRHPSW